MLIEYISRCFVDDDDGDDDVNVDDDDDDDGDVFYIYVVGSDINYISNKIDEKHQGLERIIESYVYNDSCLMVT